MADLLIADARIVDGSGAPTFAGSVEVSGDRISRIVRGEEPLRVSARMVEAAGRVLAPGSSTCTTTPTSRRSSSRGWTA